MGFIRRKIALSDSDLKSANLCSFKLVEHDTAINSNKKCVRCVRVLFRFRLPSHFFKYLPTTYLHTNRCKITSAVNNIQ